MERLEGNFLKVTDTGGYVLLEYFTYEERADVTKKSCRWIRDQGGNNSYFVLKISILKNNTEDSSSLYVVPVKEPYLQKLVTRENEFEPTYLPGPNCGNYVTVNIEKKVEGRELNMAVSFRNLTILRFRSIPNGFKVRPLGEKEIDEISCDWEEINPDGSSNAKLTIRYDSFGTLVLRTVSPVNPERQGVLLEKFKSKPTGNGWEFTTNLNPRDTLIDWNFVDFQGLTAN